MQPYLNLGFHILDGVAGLNLEGDSLSRKGLDEDLHDDDPTPWAEFWIVMKIEGMLLYRRRYGTEEKEFTETTSLSRT